jgi:hypothetical protein
VPQKRKGALQKKPLSIGLCERFREGDIGHRLEVSTEWELGKGA